MMLDRETLLLVMPGVPAKHVDDYLVRNNEAMAAAEVRDAKRAAMWLAQVGHESASFRYLEEIADGSAYEGRLDLGNRFAGDGKRFKGRGIIQLTGRSNYRQYSIARGVDFVSHPELVASPAYAFDVAAWFWTVHDLNAFADKGDLRGCTRIINGGLNGFGDRAQRYAAALGVIPA